MLCDARGLVNELGIGIEIVESFDAVVIAHIMIDGSLGVVDFPSNSGGVLALEHDLADRQGLVADG